MIRLFAALSFATALLVFVAALSLGLILSHPAQATIGAPPPELAAEAVQFASTSGTTLHGWLAVGQPNAGAVVLLHGVRGNRRAMLQRGLMLKRHGFSVLLLDLQAHGESIGQRITFGHLEGQDAAAATAFLKSHLPNERIGAIGVSLGGAACLLGPQPLDVNALVLESVFPDIDSALADRLRARLGDVMGGAATFVLAPLFRLQMPAVTGASFADLRPIDRIASVRAPVLVASGTLDTHTPIAEARALFAKAPEPKIFWPVPGAAHQDLERYDAHAYWQHILPFLVANLQTHPALHQPAAPG